jgi:threonine/homoserine/homoserine lactone efflux protein
MFNLIQFFLGLALSFIGSLPPGIINLSAMSAGIQRGARPAIILAAGASLVELGQAFVAIYFTHFIHASPTLLRWINILSVPILLLLSAYYFFFAKSEYPEPYHQKGHFSDFVKGMVISFLNVLAIPYWLFYGLLLKANDWLTDQLIPILIFSFGTAVGTFLLLWLYIRLSYLITSRFHSFARSVNRIIGFIFLFLGLVQLIRVL